MEHIHGELSVSLLQRTDDAARLLVFSKRTRHMKSKASYDEVKAMSDEEVAGNLEYVFSTIGSSLEFVTYTFLISGVTRAFTHQLVRHRVGVAFAQQAQRVATQEDFGYMISDDIAKDTFLKSHYQGCMNKINADYQLLIGAGAKAQDARGVLPTNILTNILVQINLRALMEMLNVRLCVRAQGEFQEVARMMRNLVIAEHPWVAKHLGPNCMTVGVCKFPKYDSCPISQKFPQLRRCLTTQEELEVLELWQSTQGYDPQPTAHDWRKHEELQNEMEELIDSCYNITGSDRLRGSSIPTEVQPDDNGV